jgi:hypothetical protein
MDGAALDLLKLLTPTFQVSNILGRLVQEPLKNVAPVTGRSRNSLSISLRIVRTVGQLVLDAAQFRIGL